MQILSFPQRIGAGLRVRQVLDESGMDLVHRADERAARGGRDVASLTFAVKTLGAKGRPANHHRIKNADR